MCSRRRVAGPCRRGAAPKFVNHKRVTLARIGYLCSMSGVATDKSCRWCGLAFCSCDTLRSNVRVSNTRATRVEHTSEKYSSGGTHMTLIHAVSPHTRDDAAPDQQADRGAALRARGADPVAKAGADAARRRARALPRQRRRDVCRSASHGVPPRSRRRWGWPCSPASSPSGSVWSLISGSWPTTPGRPPRSPTGSAVVRVETGESLQDVAARVAPDGAGPPGRRADPRTQRLELAGGGRRADADRAGRLTAGRCTAKTARRRGSHPPPRYLARSASAQVRSGWPQGGP